MNNSLNGFKRGFKHGLDSGINCVNRYAAQAVIETASFNGVPDTMRNGTFVLYRASDVSDSLLRKLAIIAMDGQF